MACREEKAEGGGAGGHAELKDRISSLNLLPWARSQPCRGNGWSCHPNDDHIFSTLPPPLESLFRPSLPALVLAFSFKTLSLILRHPTALQLRASASGEEHSLLMMWCPGALLPALCVGHVLFQQHQKPPSVLCLNCNHLSLGEREGTFFRLLSARGVAGFTSPVSVGNGGRWKLNTEIILQLVLEVWRCREL